MNALMLCALAAAGGAGWERADSVPRYEIVVSFDSALRSMTVTGAVHVPRALVRGDTIAVRLSTLFDGLRFTDAGGRPVAALPIGDSSAQRRHYRLHVPRTGQDTVRLRFSYRGGSGIAFGYALDGTAAFAAGLLTAWYPLLDRADSWVPIRGTGRVRFSVPPDRTIFASGVRRGTTFEFNVPSFFSYSIARYQQTVHDGPIRVTAYTLQSRPDTRAQVERMSALLSALQQVFGPYPYPEFAIAETPLQQSRAARFNGVSVEGGIFASTALMDAPFNAAFFGHELGHQWWGVLVNPIGSPGDQLLSEGMAQLGALRAVQLTESDSAARLFKTWGYPGFTRDHSAFGYAKLAAAGLDTPLVKIHGDAVSTQLVWSKAFLIYDLLAAETGEARFRSVLQQLLRTHAFRTMKWTDFTAGFEQQRPFIERWFGTTGYDTLERALGLPPRMRAHATALVNVTRGEMARRAGAIDEAARWFSTAAETVSTPDTVAVEFFARYGQGRIALIQRDTASARLRFEQSLAAPSRNLDATGGVYLELARLAAASGNTAVLRRLVNAVITAEAAAGAAGSSIERAALELLRSSPAR